VNGYVYKPHFYLKLHFPDSRGRPEHGAPDPYAGQSFLSSLSSFFVVESRTDLTFRVIQCVCDIPYYTSIQGGGGHCYCRVGGVSHKHLNMVPFGSFPHYCADLSDAVWRKLAATRTTFENASVLSTLRHTPLPQSIFFWPFQYRVVNGVYSLHSLESAAVRYNRRFSLVRLHLYRISRYSQRRFSSSPTCAG
jgi:hypothetical protein